ncbi:DNA (cytosine-5-)-methyltransferase [Campylobacter geochelonis]|uniref:Cytosine-specific methyltransferase n=1 Tax=Campylobacter geochelonis TaxID=1780362 RepID=A0A128EDD3_9BACT|nr:DNA (cytosine-5-)-methyltransferase [Campylobacter geochelonis]QKF71831.1 type II cytosine-specific DNA methyltransferase [Campylobacter geochelonis]CZE46970.1 two-component sensor [Campylobacter geochelonis]CZE47440.1 two-component sensor [Campylobacter geochelonis]CZE50936.1 two-component sensor [Campylobacter geochelonis]
MKLDVVELFAGVGGFRVGLNHIKSIDKNSKKAIENDKWNFVWANQFEPSTKTQHAFECYITRFGLKNHSNTDISKVDKTTIPNHSLLVGGFPCQDYSVARPLSKEQGIQGKKGVLFWDIKDILSKKNTPFILLENVDRLLKSPASQRGRDFAVMLKTFDELGYYVFWRVINASDYGFPQKRLRVFIFAVKKGTKYAKKFSNLKNESILHKSLLNITFPCDFDSIKNINLNKYKDIFDISNNYIDGKFLETGAMISSNIFCANAKAKKENIYTLQNILNLANNYNPKTMQNYIIDDTKLEKWQYLKGSKKIERISALGHKYTYSEGTMSFPDNLQAPARTMLTSEGSANRSSHIIFDKNLNTYRILSEVECELIQMFPPNWTDTMPSRRRYFMMGNALVTGIISRLEPNLSKIILNE